MRYAIPVEGTKGLDELVCPHFGRAEYYVIWDDETNSIEIVRNESEHFGGRGMPAEFLASKANAILCAGIGSRAIDLCNQLGLGVYIGAQGTVQDTLELLKQGRLRLATQTDGCRGRGGHYH